MRANSACGLNEIPDSDAMVFICLHICSFLMWVLFSTYFGHADKVGWEPLPCNRVSGTGSPV